MEWSRRSLGITWPPSLRCWDRVASEHRPSCSALHVRGCVDLGCFVCRGIGCRGSAQHGVLCSENTFECVRCFHCPKGLESFPFLDISIKCGCLRLHCLPVQVMYPFLKCHCHACLQGVRWQVTTFHYIFPWTLLLGFHFLRFGCLCLSFLFLSSALIQTIILAAAPHPPTPAPLCVSLGCVCLTPLGGLLFSGRKLLGFNFSSNFLHLKCSQVMSPYQMPWLVGNCLLLVICSLSFFLSWSFEVGRKSGFDEVLFADVPHALLGQSVPVFLYVPSALNSSLRVDCPVR